MEPDPQHNDPHVVRQSKKEYADAYLEEFKADSARDKIFVQFRSKSEEVAEQLLRIALTGTTEANRLKASMYITDKLTTDGKQAEDALSEALRKMTAPTGDLVDSTESQSTPRQITHDVPLLPPSSFASTDTETETRTLDSLLESAPSFPAKPTGADDQQKFLI